MFAVVWTVGAWNSLTVTVNDAGAVFLMRRLRCSSRVVVPSGKRPVPPPGLQLVVTPGALSLVLAPERTRCGTGPLKIVGDGDVSGRCDARRLRVVHWSPRTTR